MAFAQLTYRESRRDIETCLSVHAPKLYHMGLRQPVRRSTLADANEGRDWRIHAEVAQRLIVRARKLYADEDLELELTNTVYALDATTIDLCLSVFPWAHFRTDLMLDLVAREIVERAQNDRLEHHHRVPRLAPRPRLARLVQAPPHRFQTATEVFPRNHPVDLHQRLVLRVKPGIPIRKVKKPHLTHEHRLPLSTNRQPDSNPTPAGKQGS